MIQVVAAVIIKDDKVFLARRAAHKDHAGKWEFPGGKIEQGESPQQALQRELLEELGVDVKIHDAMESYVHTYPHLQIELLPYRTELLTEDFQLTDHDEVKWVPVSELMEYDLTEADVELALSVRL